MKSFTDIYSNNVTQKISVAFETAIKNYPSQYYVMNPRAVNSIIESDPTLSNYRGKKLTKSQMWVGEKLKASQPQIFTDEIIVAGVIEGTRKETIYGETLKRYSIQPCWITGRPVIVKEVAYAIDSKKTMYFFGQKVNIEEAKQTLIFPIIQDIINGSVKAKSLLTKVMDQEYDPGLFEDAFALSHYLNSHFESFFYQENLALFHVEHSVIGEEDNPMENWRLVRLAENRAEEEVQYTQLKEAITNAVSSRLYIETLNYFDATQLELKK